MIREFSLRYLPKTLSPLDQKRQIRNLRKTRKMYRKGKYINRQRLLSYKNKPSGHIAKARRLYGVDKIVPSAELARASGCSIDAMRKIVRKGEGAYYSSGSRPNQTAQSWAYARLASSLTGGNAAIVDFDILDKGCNHRKMAYTLANDRKVRPKDRKVRPENRKVRV